MLTKEQLIMLLMIRKRPGNLFSSLPISVSDKFVELYVEEKARNLAKIFYEELFDIAIRYTKERSFFSDSFGHQAAGLRTMLTIIINNNEFDVMKKLFLLIQLVLDLYRYLANHDSNRFISLLHVFMNNHCLLINDISTPALPVIINETPYCYYNFYNYFLGGCHIFYNSKQYFSEINANYESRLKITPYYEYNSRIYTLEKLVRNFIVIHNSKAGFKKPRQHDELDDPQYVIDMHSIL